MARVILHMDLDAFFCAVEEQRDPSLVGKAFAVGGRPDQRGVVSSCSYAARQYGVRSAMPMAQAVRRCPGLLIVHQHFKDYQQKSRQVMELLGTITPMVEQISIDEAFLDVTGIAGTGYEIARRIQTQIKDELGLPASFGVASNKLVAKIANTIGKSRAQPGFPPRAILDVAFGEEASFFAPLSIRELWGVGPKTGEQLRKMGIETIGQLAAWPEKDLVRRFGKLGGDISLRAKGYDTRPVETEHEAKSISKETTFVRDVRDRDELHHTLRRLAQGVGRQVRKSGLRAGTVRIKLRWSDFTTISRQMTPKQPIDQDAEFLEAAEELLHEAWDGRQAVRLIGIAASGFETGARQMELWETEESQKGRKLQDTLDTLRDRFGESAIKLGSDIKRKDDKS